MTKYTPYTTKTGDRWDTISYAAYGNVKYLGEIMRANPTVPAFVEFPAGIYLNIPIKERPEVTKSNLPPWRR